MRVLHISTNDTAGGAAIAAFRLHQALNRHGVKSKMLVARKFSHDQNVEVWPAPAPKSKSRIRQMIDSRLQQRHLQSLQPIPPNCYFNDCRSNYNLRDVRRTIDECDLVHLHWTAKFLDWPTMLPELAIAKPVVWTLHDFYPFSGIWHYPPSAKVSDGLDKLNADVLEVKKSALGRIPSHRLHVVAPSSYMAGEAARSDLLGRFPISCIPHGLDTDVFRPVDKRVAREALQIPSNANVVAFVADSLSDPRKGGPQLLSALSQISIVDLLLTAGKSPLSDSPIPNVHLGRLNSDRLLAQFYSAADLFICPSLQEAFGQTVFEAMACGVPVVGFRAGGIPDMVRPNQTGWLSDVGDSRQLADGINAAFADSTDRTTIAHNCRQVAVAEYDQAIQSRNLCSLYQKAIASRA